MGEGDPNYREADRFARDAPRGCSLVVKGWIFYTVVMPVIFLVFVGGAHWLDELIRQPTWRDPQTSVFHLIGFVAFVFVTIRLFRAWTK